MNNTPTRKERRASMKYQGLLKMKSKLPFDKWLDFTKESIENGHNIFTANFESMERSVAEQLEKNELKLIKGWQDIGYTADEIEKLREAYAILSNKNLVTWHVNKKIARNLIKKVNESKTKRDHG